MFAKVLLFFLIAGVFAGDPIVEQEEDDIEIIDVSAPSVGGQGDGIPDFEN